jgi:hypothetical protein
MERGSSQREVRFPDPDGVHRTPEIGEGGPRSRCTSSGRGSGEGSFTGGADMLDLAPFVPPSKIPDWNVAPLPRRVSASALVGGNRSLQWTVESQCVPSSSRELLTVGLNYLNYLSLRDRRNWEWWLGVRALRESDSGGRARTKVGWNKFDPVVGSLAAESNPKPRLLNFRTWHDV